MKKEDLSALQNLYKGIFTEDSEPSVTDKPTTAKTITDGLGIYETHIKSTESPVPQRQVTLSEEAEVVTHITSSTPSTTPLKSASGILGNAQWGSVSTVNDIEELYSAMYESKGEEKKEDQDKDGDNDFDDVRIARMIASGMSKEEAMRKVKEDPKGDEVKEEVELDENLLDRAKSGLNTAAKYGGLGIAGAVANRLNTPSNRKTVKSAVGKASSSGALGLGAKAASMIKKEEIEMEGYKGKHGQSEKEYQDGRSQGGKMVSGDSEGSGAKYTHGRRVDDGGAGPQPAGGSKKPKAQGRMDRGTRADLEYRKANLKKKMKEENTLNKEDTEYNNGSISEMAQEELIYNIVASYLLENSFAEDIDDANSMMEAMSSAWVGTILEEYNEYVEDYNVFVENLEIAGYDLTEATDEDIEEAYKDVDKKKAVEKAANKEKASKNIEKFTKFRAKGIAQSNKLRGSITGGRSADRPAVKGNKETQEKGGYNPEKLNKDWYSRARPDSKMKRKGGEMETVSQRMDREHPYKNRMTGKMGREFGSRAAANVTDVLKALEGNRKKK
jgi:hypothetical protein